MRVSSSTALALAAGIVFLAVEAGGEFRFRQLNQYVTDSPAKTSIVQHVLLTGVADEQAIREEMLERLEIARQRTGFLYRDSANEILVHVYVTEPEARAADGRWLARLVYDAARGETPAISFEEGRMRAMTGGSAPAAARSSDGAAGSGPAAKDAPVVVESPPSSAPAPKVKAPPSAPAAPKPSIRALPPKVAR
ncbi:MAG TPA: hypothetical protein VEL28_02075 [Candidatus Binatia bacterium]|nr:hypothetical protein [Candidatus Binatia bacterium]